MDIGPGREGWIGHQRMGDVIVGAIHVAVFLYLSVVGGLEENEGLGGDRGERMGKISRLEHTAVSTLYNQFRTCWGTIMPNIAERLAMLPV